MNLTKTMFHVTSGLLISLPFLGPIPFYYTLTFGIVPWLVINGADSIPGDFICGPYKIHFYPGIFTVSVALWAICLDLVSRWEKHFASQA